MRKLLVAGLVFALALGGGVAFAAKKAPAKKKPATVECAVGDQKMMTSTLDECMKKGGLVLNYPGPSPEKAKAKAKAKKK